MEFTTAKMSQKIAAYRMLLPGLHCTPATSLQLLFLSSLRTQFETAFSRPLHLTSYRHIFGVNPL